MKTTLNLLALKTSLQHLQNSIPSNPQLPILSSIYLKLEGGELIMASTDLYLGVRVKAHVDSKAEFERVVPGDIFKDLVSSFSNEVVELEVKDKELVIESGASRLKMPTQSVEEYPDFPQIGGQRIEIEAEVISQIKELVGFAASSDQARPVLTTVFLNFKDGGLEAVGTDGFRLAVLSFDQIKTKQKSQSSLLIPVRAFNEVAKILERAGEDRVELHVSQELKQIKFEIGEVEVFVRLIEGDYPPYGKIIPPQFEIEAELLGQDLQDELQRAFVLAREASNIVECKLGEEEMVIKSSAPAAGDYQGKVQVNKLKGSGDKIAFNVKYILEFLSNVKPEKIKFFMNESLKPAMFTIDGVENFKYIVMPFRVNE